MTTNVRNIFDHNGLAQDDLSDCAQNIARYIGSSGIAQNSAVVAAALLGNAAVTFDASKGNVFVETISANVTSSSITNGVTGQQVTVQFVQASGGSHTVSWPTAKYAAGTAPTTSTTAGYVDSVTYVYDGTNWQETNRSIANH